MMSEGGRKVWNREQLEALNDGAVFLRKPHGVEYLCEIQHNYNDQGEVFSHAYWCFGSEEPDEPVGDREYPIEVIWEPNDERL
jgi:hypothetical protein